MLPFSDHNLTRFIGSWLTYSAQGLFSLTLQLQTLSLLVLIRLPDDLNIGLIFTQKQSLIVRKSFKMWE